MRLRSLAFVPRSLAQRLFYIPVKVEFIPNPTSENAAGDEDFEETLMSAADKAKTFNVIITLLFKHNHRNP